MTPFRMDVGDLELWAVRHGEGPDVLLIAGLSDPAEAWQFQLDGLADRYCLIAFHNRGAGRTPLPDGPLSVPMMAGDAAALLRALKVQAAQYLVRDLLTERAGFINMSKNSSISCKRCTTPRRSCAGRAGPIRP